MNKGHAVATLIGCEYPVLVTGFTPTGKPVCWMVVSDARDVDHFALSFPPHLIYQVLGADYQEITR